MASATTVFAPVETTSFRTAMFEGALWKIPWRNVTQPKALFYESQKWWVFGRWFSRLGILVGFCMLGFRGLRKASRVTLIQLDAPWGICRVDLAMVESSHGLPNICQQFTYPWNPQNHHIQSENPPWLILSHQCWCDWHILAPSGGFLSHGASPVHPALGPFGDPPWLKTPGTGHVCDQLHDPWWEDEGLGCSGQGANYGLCAQLGTRKALRNEWKQCLWRCLVSVFVLASFLHHIYMDHRYAIDISV